MEGPISFWVYKEQESNLILPEYDDDDDDELKSELLQKKTIATNHSLQIYTMENAQKFKCHTLRSEAHITCM